MHLSYHITLLLRDLQESFPVTLMVWHISDSQYVLCKEIGCLRREVAHEAIEVCSRSEVGFPPRT